MRGSSEGWDAFEAVWQKDPASVVPILGTGFRRWLIEHRQVAAGLLDWAELMRGVAHSAGLAPPGTQRTDDLPLAFEMLVSQDRSHRHAHRREASLVREHIAGWLHNTACTADLHAHVAGRRSRFLGAGWRNVVDLNVDPLLVGVNGAPVISANARQLRTTAARVDDVCIWYPHGLALPNAKPWNLVFGVQRYGRALTTSVRAMDGWLASGKTAPSEHWVSAAMPAPVLVLGCALSAADWDVVWPLLMRGRIPDPRPVFRLTCDEDPDRQRAHDLLGASYRELHGGPTWADAWKRLGQVIPALDPSTPPPFEG